MRLIFLKLTNQSYIIRLTQALIIILTISIPWEMAKATPPHKGAYQHAVIKEPIRAKSQEYQIVRLANKRVDPFYKPFNPKKTSHKKSNHLSLFFILGLLLYYGICWHYVGRDPKRGSIIPIYKPPANLSPVMMHYIANKGFQSVETAFGAAIIHLSVLEYIKIHESAFIYTLEKLKEPDEHLSVEERTIMKILFKRDDMVKVNDYREFVPIQEKMKEVVKKKLSNSIFASNLYVVVFGILFSIVYFFYLLKFVGMGYIIHLLAGCILIAVSCKMIASIIRRIKLGMYGDRSQYYVAIFWGLMYLPFGYFTVLAIIAAMLYFGFFNTLSIFAIILLHFLFAELVKRPTKSGQKLIDAINGFRLYLSIADKDNVESFKTPRLTPELFKAYLPYGIALGLKNKWTHNLITQIVELTVEERHYRNKTRSVHRL